MPGWGGADKEAAEDDIPYFVNRAAHGQIHQFAIIVANQSHRFVKGIDGLNRPTNSFLYDLYTAVQTPSVPDQVFIAQAKVIKEAASRESCVIVGRCADYILRDDPRRLSVFVHAPLDERVRRAREEYGVQEPNLEAYVLRQDRARASYYNYFATGKWGQSREYDLCVNSHMGIAAAVAVIKAAALAVAGETGA